MSTSDPVRAATSTKPLTEKIAILDCGAQYTKVIDRRVRELNLDSEILPLDSPANDLRGFQAIILSGGPNSVFAEDAPHFDPTILHLGLPVLGICYGMQLIAQHLGGTVAPGNLKEFGETEIDILDEGLLFAHTPVRQSVLMSHGDKVTELPPEFTPIATSGNIVAAMAHRAKRLYGVQFHPEVDLTDYGQTILRNFLFEISGLTGNYPLETRLEETLENIRHTVGDSHVFVLVSGGVDSAVTAALLLKALGPEKVYALHMDTGFMRHQESETVCEALRQLGLTNLDHIKAESIFLHAKTEIEGDIVGPLNTVTNPEEKRRIIGDTFFKLTQDAILTMNLDLDKTFIAQGTLRPDLIESGNVGVSKIAHKIKTHHNDVPIIQAQRDKGLIIETNRDWHKDEVRKIGAMLGLPDSVTQRQPFPGPGLAIRTLCTREAYLPDAFFDLNAAIDHKAKTLGLQGNVLPVQSVGVQGDYRSYSRIATLSGNYPRDWNQLRSLVQDIPNAFKEINRVTLVINNTPLPPLIETITPTLLVPETLKLLREIDYTVTEGFRKAGLMTSISQLLVVLVPISVKHGHHSIAIRAVVTSDYMTARPARLGDEISWALIENLADYITNVYPIDWVLYDMTSKPPATVEWE